MGGTQGGLVATASKADWTGCESPRWPPKRLSTHHPTNSGLSLSPGQDSSLPTASKGGASSSPGSVDSAPPSTGEAG